MSHCSSGEQHKSVKNCRARCIVARIQESSDSISRIHRASGPSASPSPSREIRAGLTCAFGDVHRILVGQAAVAETSRAYRSACCARRSWRRYRRAPSCRCCDGSGSAVGGCEALAVLPWQAALSRVHLLAVLAIRHDAEVNLAGAAAGDLSSGFVHALQVRHHGLHVHRFHWNGIRIQTASSSRSFAPPA